MFSFNLLCTKLKIYCIYQITYKKKKTYQALYVYTTFSHLCNIIAQSTTLCMFVTSKLASFFFEKASKVARCDCFTNLTILICFSPATLINPGWLVPNLRCPISKKSIKFNNIKNFTIFLLLFLEPSLVLLMLHV